MWERVPSQRIIPAAMNAPDMKSALIYNATSQNYQCKIRQKYMRELDLCADDIVLDVGCGTGRPCKEIADKVKFVTGFDISPAMIDAAKACNSGENIEYHVADAQSFSGDLPKWKHSAFDKVTCFYVIHYCMDQRRVLENILHCLKPGGRLLMVAVLQSVLQSPKCSFGKTADIWLRMHPKWGPYMKNYVHYQTAWDSEEDFLDFVRSVGFDICQSTPEEILTPQFDESSREEVNGIIRVLLKHFEVVPEDLREECVDDVRQWLHDVTPKRADGYPISATGRSCLLTLVAQRKVVKK